MKKEKGFTLIELVIVIVILGILAATGLSKFMDVTEEAKNASVEGTASGFLAAAHDADPRPEGEQGPDARLPDGGRKAHPEVREHLGNPG